MKPIIRVENLSKEYRIGAQRASYATLRDKVAEVARAPWKLLRERGDRADETIWALRDVNFAVQPGEVMGIIGQNGAGKSTLLKILSRITEPTRGEVLLYGRVASLLEVGTGFHPELTGRDNIYLNGAILGMRTAEIQRRFDEIVSFSEIERFIDTPVKHYSSGMYMRLAFSVAAHLEPEILMVDEVLAVGDIAFQTKCLNKMGEVSSRGRTVILVSHNLDAIERISSRALIIDQGEVTYSGLSSDVVAHYLRHTKRLQKHSSVVHLETSGITCSWKINGRSPEEVVPWETGLPLEIAVDLECQHITACPPVDLGFYCMNGRKLFGVMSDPVIDHSEEPPRKRWQVIFNIGKMPLSRQIIYFDLGIRMGAGAGYAALWKRAGEVQVSSETQSPSLSSDSVVAPAIIVSIAS